MLRCSFVTCLEHFQTIILSSSACKLLLTAVQDSMFDIKQNGEYNKERFGTEFDKQHPLICQSAVQSPIATTAGFSDSCTNSCAPCLSFDFVCFPRTLFKQTFTILFFNTRRSFFFILNINELPLQLYILYIIKSVCKLNLISESWLCG